ncbi:LysM peptidoglycan-binding domain-containing protein [uncultured Dokdonia sp.]|uniref:CIS tube protein n=1 Tax=uncultured Dokdonia sp. TaxID=575653 RepID=UPI0026361309|nr:LysM peptidoglycan-binding domain-containing protein [uncultured Dokdonia sp.]
MEGELAKLEIATYTKSDYKTKVRSGAFNAFINPESYSITYKNNFNTDRSPGQQRDNYKYDSSVSPDLDLEFLFDGTGVVQQNSGNRLLNLLSGGADFVKDTVKGQIDKFLEATGEYDGTIHKPYNVIISWGDFEFKGVLLELTLDYKLFTPDGKPLRAIGKAKFHESISPELAEAEVKTNSPDLTHIRMVKAGDTLPLMTERIYGDDKYYLEVAKINNITSFRQLQPGTEIFFPPIEKVS